MAYEFQTRAKLARPCPLCGNREILTYKKDWMDENKVGSKYYVTFECRCGVSFMADGNEDLDEAYRIALRAWNRRSA